MFTSDNIYFIQLFKDLWSGKLIIAFVTIFFAVGSFSLSMSMQEWWSSQADVIQAQPQDMSEYQQQVKQYQAVFNVYQEDGTVLVSNELDNLVNSSVLYQRFLDTFNSNNNKRNFLEDSIKFHGVNNDSDDSLEMKEDAKRRLYEEWFGKITAVKIEQIPKISPYKLSFQSTTKESSFQLLKDYIYATENQVRQDAFNNLKAVVNGKRNELIQQRIILETQAKNLLLVEVERVKYAIAIAQAAGVEKPVQIGRDNELFSIDLGSKGLEAKVKALESVKNLSVIEPRLQQIDAKLDMLNNLEIDRTVDFQTFRYLENVEQPITRDKPKRALIVVLGTLLGGMLGVAIVLIRFAFRKTD